MPDYQEMYLTLFRATEQAVRTLIAAQQACEELYIHAPRENLIPLSKGSEGEERQATGTGLSAAPCPLKQKRPRKQKRPGPLTGKSKRYISQREKAARRAARQPRAQLERRGSGVPKPEPSDSGSGLDARSSRMSAR